MPAERREGSNRREQRKNREFPPGKSEPEEVQEVVVEATPLIVEGVEATPLVESTKYFVCPADNCNYRAAQLGHLKIHERKHTGVKPFICDFENCNYASAKYDNLKRHQKAKHTNERPYKCPQCTYAAVEPSQLKSHMTMHTGEKKHKCTFEGCSYSCAKISHMKVHMRKHTGERPFKCTYEDCSYAGVEKGALVRHMRKHTGERPYKCTFPNCKYSASTSGTLKLHLRTHTGEKPFKCTFPNCSYSAAVSGALKKHLAVHEGAGLIYCSFKDCKFAATTSTAMNRHSREHEGVTGVKSTQVSKSKSGGNSKSSTSAFKTATTNTSTDIVAKSEIVPEVAPFLIVSEVSEAIAVPQPELVTVAPSDISDAIPLSPSRILIPPSLENLLNNVIPMIPEPHNSISLDL